MQALPDVIALLFIRLIDQGIDTPMHIGALELGDFLDELIELFCRFQIGPSSGYSSAFSRRHSAVPSTW